MFRQLILDSFEEVRPAVFDTLSNIVKLRETLTSLGTFSRCSLTESETDCLSSGQVSWNAVLGRSNSSSPGPLPSVSEEKLATWIDAPVASYEASRSGWEDGRLEGKGRREHSRTI